MRLWHLVVGVIWQQQTIHCCQFIAMMNDNSKDFPITDDIQKVITQLDNNGDGVEVDNNVEDEENGLEEETNKITTKLKMGML